ncbi:MAG: TolC family protein [Limnohabitans sp.]|jgi:outer membrane protein TolC|nr:TolC family protein [Limnohabitans sp.]
MRYKVRVGTACTVVAAITLAGCRAGVFDNEDPRWRVPPAQLHRIDSMDPVAASTTQPVTLEEAAKEALASIEVPALPQGAVELSLADVRAAVLANNLDLRTVLVDPAIASANLSAEEAKFQGVFFAEYDRSNNSLFADLVQGEAADSDSFNAGFRVPLATGGSISLSSPLNRSANGLTFGGTGDDWLAAASLSMSQPLLRGAGIDANTHSIRVAAWQGQIADTRTKLEAIRILANADKAYWNVYSAYRELGVRRAQYETAVQQLERARRRVQQGDAPEIEVVRAESGVGRTLEQIIVADANLRIRQRALKRLMNRSDLPVSSDTPLTPKSDANPVSLTLDGAKLSEQAIANRMELLELELRLAIDTSEIGFRRNAALPLFVLDYGYNLQGTGPEASNAYGSLGNDDSFDVGLRAEIPLGNDVLESRVNTAILQRVQRLATREARRLAIRTEVFDALDNLAQSWQRILAARLEALLAARTLVAEERQFDVGLRTIVEVLDANARLADAQSREVAALASYQIAQVDLAFATGTSLGAARIRWEPFSLDELPALENIPDAKAATTPSGFTVETP